MALVTRQAYYFAAFLKAHELWFFSRYPARATFPFTGLQPLSVEPKLLCCYLFWTPKQNIQFTDTISSKALNSSYTESDCDNTESLNLSSSHSKWALFFFFLFPPLRIFIDLLQPTFLLPAYRNSHTTDSWKTCPCRSWGRRAPGSARSGRCWGLAVHPVLVTAGRWRDEGAARS